MQESEQFLLTCVKAETDLKTRHYNTCNNVSTTPVLLSNTMANLLQARASLKGDVLYKVCSEESESRKCDGENQYDCSCWCMTVIVELLIWSNVDVLLLRSATMAALVRQGQRRILLCPSLLSLWPSPHNIIFQATIYILTQCQTTSDCPCQLPQSGETSTSPTDRSSYS